MDRERAQTYLRRQAEAELRQATPRPGGGDVRAAGLLRVAKVARVLTAAGALDEAVSDQILDEFGFALEVRQAAAGGPRVSPRSLTRPPLAFRPPSGLGLSVAVLGQRTRIGGGDVFLRKGREAGVPPSRPSSPRSTASGSRSSACTAPCWRRTRAA